MVLGESFEILEEYKGNKGFFIKSFLFDDTFNQNEWRITAEAIKRDTKSFLDKEFFGKTAPFIIRDDRMHPTPGFNESMIDLQEPARVGNFIDFGFEEKNFSDGATIKAWQISEIIEDWAKDAIRSKEVQFISPSVRARDETIDEDGRAVITAFIGSHNAGVDNPAYGMQKAQIKGVCESDHGTCMSNLKNVQASKEKPKSTIELHSCGMVTVNFSATDVSDCLSKKLQKGEKPTKQDIAICLSEEKKGGLDQISLQNITRPELLLKKKDALGNKNTKYSNLKEKTNSKKMIPMTKQAQEQEPSEDGTCPEGFVMGDNGKCILTAAAYIAAEEEEKKEKESESATKETGKEEDPKVESAEVETLKEEQAALRKDFDNEIRKPLVASIIEKKGKLELIKSADVVTENKSLMARKVEDLKNLNADLTQMMKSAGQDLVEEHTDNARFVMDSHSASTDESSENKYGFLEKIREKMN